MDERKEALRRRTKAFAGAVVRFYISLDKSRDEIRILGKQLLRSGTSVSANYREASRARSDAEFISKIDQCAQEADESQLWLELLQDDCGVSKESVQPVWKEADELIAIFVPCPRTPKNASTMTANISDFRSPVSGLQSPVSGFRSLNMKILITGGAGFVGSNLALALCAELPAADIICMDNLYRRGSELNVPRLEKAGVKFHRGDVRNTGAFPSGPFDFVIECSAEPSVLAGQDGSPDYLFQTNLVGAYNCLEKARQWKSGFIFLSTSRVYPIARLEAHPWREEATRFAWADDGTPGITSRGVGENVEMTGARSLYGFTKLAAEQLIEEYRAAYGLRAAVNRCGVIAGPWQFGKADQGVAALWVMAHHFGRPLGYIGYGGTGKQVRDFLHVADLCDLILEQIQEFDRWDGWLGNVSGGLQNAASLCELTGLCEEIIGGKIPIAPVPANRPNDLRIFIADCSRLFERTKWRPGRNVRRIIQDTHAWVVENAGQLQKLKH